ncbi:MAG: hypothetical protein ACRERC_09945 [Candidatus Binatia bacterium]
MTNSKGITIAALIVAANFAIVMQLTGVSYGRFEWTAFAAAYDTPTATATATATSTATATATATPTPLPNGAGCIADMQCASTFCSNGFCCNERCDGPGEYCNLAGDQGTCLVPAAPAPAMSDGALAAAGGLLIAIAWLALRVRRRRDRAAY